MRINPLTALLCALRRSAPALCLVLLAGGCAPSLLAEGQGGYYKVGKPYEINGQRYRPRVNPHYVETGVASWYGPGFHGKKTANGETFDMNLLSAAHRTLPMPVYVRVTNLENGRKLIVRVNDRGPFAKDRVIDLSRRAAQLLGFLKQGTARVELRYAGRAKVGQAAPRSRVATRSRTNLLPRNPAIVERGGKAAALHVQAAAFSQRRRAASARAALASLGPGRIVERKTGKGMLHVLVFGPFPDRLSAEAVRAVMRKRGFPDAFIVSGES